MEAAPLSPSGPDSSPSTCERERLLGRPVVRSGPSTSDVLISHSLASLCLCWPQLELAHSRLLRLL